MIGGGVGHLKWTRYLAWVSTYHLQPKCAALLWACGREPHTMFLIFKKIEKGKTAVYSGKKRVGTIFMGGKFIRAEGRFMDAINAYVRSMS